jgi:hypothetical protein
VIILAAMLFALIPALALNALIGPCRCGHPRNAHEHYRGGTDCGPCGPAVCPRFHRIQWAAFMRPNDFQKRVSR